MKMTNPTTLTAGIDTGKEKLDIAVHGRPGVLTVTNDARGWKKLTAHFAAVGVGRVGIEATGGYERGVVRHLQAAGLTVIVLQPLQVKAFAQLHLRRAKNDRLDAALIAACTSMMPDPMTAPDPRLQALTDQLTFIEQQEEDIARLKTRLEHVDEPRLARVIKADIKRIVARRAAELRRLLAAVRAEADLARRLELVISIPGIGERTALALILRMPELGRISREEAASLAGLAPFVHQSGKHKGETHIGGGRSRLRRSLFAAAVPASFRWNPALVALYVRLTQRGKPPVSALTACARKLLVFANTVLARGTPWRKDQVPA
jgi:transposase